MRTLNQKGLSTLSIVLIAAVIIIAGGLVWWSLSDNTDSSENNNQNQNTDLDTSNWLTYNSADSDYVMFNKLEPAFQFKYPPELDIQEDREEVWIMNSGDNNLDPRIIIGYTNESIEDNIVDWCREKLLSTSQWEYDKIIDTEEESTINGIKSAYLSYSYPHFDKNTEYNIKAVCIPFKGTVLTISGIPRDSDLVNKYFNKVVETVEISD